MGKWSYSRVTWSEEYKAAEEAVRAMSKDEVQKEWELLGRPNIKDYRLTLWSGISGGGWVVIDNSGTKEDPSNPIHFFCDRKEFLRYDHGLDQKGFEHWFHRACLLAHRMGIEKTIPH